METTIINNGVEELPWLDENYISKIINTFEGSPVSLKKHRKEVATSKGENFASALHRVIVEYELDNCKSRRNLSMIVKSQLKNELFDEIQQEFNIFEREAQLYRAIKASCEEALMAVGDTTKFGPRALYVDEKIIVLEDLKVSGYHICDVKKGLTYEQARFMLEKVAKFHAATKVLYETDQDLFRYHQKSNLGEKETPLHDFYRYSFKTCLELVKTVPELHEYVKKLEEYEPNLLKRAINVFTRSVNGFNTLNHGDLWVNNLMYKMEDDKILDVLLVDYQEGYFGSPGIDLNYFIYSSLQGDVYEKRYNLIEEYHRILADTLQKLNFSGKIPSIEDILKEYYSKGEHGLFTATSFFPILINEHTEYSDPENFLTDDDEARRKRFIVYNNPKYINYLKVVLKDFAKNQIL